MELAASQFHVFSACSNFTRLFLPPPILPCAICFSCPCDRAEGEKKGGKQIVTCSKNSSPVDGPSLWGCFGEGHAAIYTYWRASEEVQVLHPACLDP